MANLFYKRAPTDFWSLGHINRPHGTMIILEKLCMLLLVARTVAEGPENEYNQRHNDDHRPNHWWYKRCICANAVAPLASQSCPARLARNKLNKHPTRWTIDLSFKAQICHWLGQLMTGLCVNFVQPLKTPQIGWKAWHSKREHHEAKYAGPPGQA